MCEYCSPVPGTHCCVCGGTTPLDLFGAAGLSELQLSLAAVDAAAAPDGEGAGRVAGILYGRVRPTNTQLCGGGFRVLKKKLAGA